MQAPTIVKIQIILAGYHAIFLSCESVFKPQPAVHFTASDVLLIHRPCCVFNSDPLILSHPRTNMALYWLMLSLIFIRQLRHLIEQWGSPCFLLWSPGGEAATRPSRRTQALLCCLIVIKDFFQPQPEYSWDCPFGPSTACNRLSPFSDFELHYT